MEVTVDEARSALLLYLTTSIKQLRHADDISEVLAEWPFEIAIVALRATLSELLSTIVVCRKAPTPATLRWLFQSLAALPEHPVAGRSGLVSDYATALLLNTLGITDFVSDDVDPSIWNPPEGWVDFGQWTKDLSPLALRELSTPLHDIVCGRELDLARAACLAAINRQIFTSVRILRWLPFCLSRSPETSSMLELFDYLERGSGHCSDVNFHLSVTRHCIDTSVR